MAAKSDNVSLQGYLEKLKIGTQTRSRIFKKRWFKTSNTGCLLFYYSSEEDVNPLGSISIAKATLSFKESNQKRYVFQIRTYLKTYLLDASNFENMVYWVSGLQNFRQNFLGSLKNYSVNDSMNNEKSSINYDQSVRFNHVPQSHQLKDLSITNLKTEIKNSVFSLLKNKSSANQNNRQFIFESNNNQICSNCLELRDTISCNNIEKNILTEELLNSNKILIDLNNEISLLQQKCSYLDMLTESNNNISELIQQLVIKDSNISSLNCQLYEANLSLKFNQNEENSNNNTNFKSYKCEDIKTFTNTIESLEFDCKAYKMQNQLLNEEISNLSNILESQNQHEDDSQIQITNLEALCYQLKSKCMSLMHEMTLHNLNIPISIETEINEINADFDTSHMMSAYDKFGFMLIHDKNVNFKSISEDLKILSYQKLNEPVDNEKLLIKWESILLNSNNNEQIFLNNVELKNLLRLGCPDVLRAKVWKIIINLKMGKFRHSQISNTYKDLLASIQIEKLLISHSHQIEIDLLRTMPNNVFFEKKNSAKISSLRNILLAFSIHSPEVGYCQGLNQIAAILLLMLEEEEAFWGLVYIVDILMPQRYYDRTLISAHADQRVLKELVSEKLPQLHEHFINERFELSLFTFSWFLTIFSNCLPIQTTLRIWDVFLYEGSKVLFRFALAVLKYNESDLLLRKESKLLSFAQTMTLSIFNSNKLCKIAFNEINPMPMWVIKLKRNSHVQKLSLELEELNKMRNSLKLKDSYFLETCNDDLSD